MQIRLNDRIAVVTGGSRGIGRAISLSLATTGATVVVNYRGNQAAADETVASIVAAGGQAVAIQADVAKGEDVERLFKEVNERFGRIDILVNNAGITRDTLMLRMKDDDWDAVMDTNLRGLFLCTRAVLRPMTRVRWGRIINITSVVGLMGNAGQANYAAAKAGIIGFTKSVAREIGSRTITVNAVAPGFIDTELTASLGPETREALIKQIPLGRLGTPDDVAGLVTFLASEQAAYITGQTFNSDGGMVMQ
ncbi:MAG: 3-oxoacyl-ACP reductase FabG [Chloroflexales bacterium]|nr:3-oxoacyl-ACP reductase FabG [Chloroflexales bacterium]